VTNTGAPAADAVQHYKSRADIERDFRVLKSTSKSARRATDCRSASPSLQAQSQYRQN